MKNIFNTIWDTAIRDSRIVQLDNGWIMQLDNARLLLRYEGEGNKQQRHISIQTGNNEYDETYMMDDDLRAVFSRYDKNKCKHSDYSNIGCITVLRVAEEFLGLQSVKEVSDDI